MQQDIWYAHHLSSAAASPHLALRLHFPGNADPDALRSACRDVVRAHPALSSRFPDRAGRPLHAALDDASMTRAATPTHLTDARRNAEHLTQPFDVDGGPLFRFGLATDAQRRTILTGVFHHLVFDGASRDILARDLVRHYRERRRGRAATDRPATSYHDYVRRERALLDTEPPPGWRDTLAWEGAALSDVLHGRADGELVPVPAALGPARYARLTHLAGTCGVTRHAVVLATFAATVAAYARPSGLQVPAIAVPMGTRTAEFVDTVGPFVNEAPLRLVPETDDTFTGFLHRVRQRARAAYRLRGFPVAELRRRAAMAPWRPSIVLGYRRATLPGQIPDPGLPIGYEAIVPVARAGSELELQLLDHGEQVTGWLCYDPARFAADTMRDLLGHWYRMIDSVTADPSAPLRSHDLLDEGQRRRTGTLASGPRVDFDGPDTIHGLFEAQATATPDAPAVRTASGTTSYASLDRHADRLAERLTDAGARCEEPVLVRLPRSVQAVAALLGVLKAGACYVPLDSDDPPERQAFIAARSGARILVTAPGEAPPPRFDGTVVAAGAQSESLRTRARPGRTKASTGNDLAYAMFTSGSTGVPKAAMITHAALRNRLLWMQSAYRLTGADRVLHKTSAGFDVSGWEIFWPLVCGATLVLAPPGAHRDSAALARLVDAEAVSVMHFVPSALRAFLDEPGLHRLAGLRLVVCSGETLAPDLVRRFHRRLRCQLENLYGPTEAAIDVTAAPCPEGTDPVPIGTPIANATVRVLDSRLSPVPIGVTGEIFLGGLPLARGYLGQPGLTAQRFVADPHRRGGRLYRTGDLGRYRFDGMLEYRGRVDDQIKIRGRRVEPGEVEAVLHGHPAVRQAAVIAADTGHDDQELVAYLVPPAGQAPPDPVVLDRWLRSRLPDALVPAALIWLEKLPRTGSGKLDRRALPAPRPSREEHVCPRTDTEHVVAAVWAELFGLDSVGAHDDFFDLGGHSLLATRTLSRLRERFGVELPMRLVFDRPTVAALAAAVDEVRAR